jgi:hypothetical protein
MSALPSNGQNIFNANNGYFLDGGQGQSGASNPNHN